eukprot:11059102-Lingulodinium_polyedra.AAC.1
MMHEERWLKHATGVLGYKATRAQEKWDAWKADPSYPRDEHGPERSRTQLLITEGFNHITEEDRVVKGSSVETKDRA